MSASGTSPGAGAVPPLEVAELWRYPVKSLRGERLDRLFLGQYGVVGDRAFALVAAGTGKILTAKREPRLLAASASCHGGRAVITLPTGRQVSTSDPAADTVLSEWLGQPVRLRRWTGTDGTARIDDYVKDLGDPATLAGFDLPDWGFVDESPVHLLSEATLRAARQEYPEGDWDVRRFRPNVLLRSAADGRPEDTLIGGAVELGSALLDVSGPTSRCVMMTQPQPGLPKDREILRTVVTRYSAALGVYADVARPGAVGIGDRLAPAAVKEHAR